MQSGFVTNASSQRTSLLWSLNPELHLIIRFLIVFFFPLSHFLFIPSNHFVIKIYELYYYVKETSFIKHDKSPQL